MRKIQNVLVTFRMFGHLYERTWIGMGDVKRMWDDMEIITITCIDPR